jgi:glycosyltransferase involved in cell wall biosynthesis|tara:strand:+ start:5167 stop:5802 length:636 start_codon:yes stop_codon:yes gene_type:complete
MIKLSYGITVHDEADELNRLLEVLVHKTDKEDEIVICVDGEDDAVEHVLQSWTQQYGHDGMKIIKIYQRKLDGDFAAQKNSVIENSTGDYIFHIDADEYPSDGLLEYVKPILEANDIDLIWVPRVNTVDGITEQHIQQWGWRVSEAGWVNYPDYQSRIFKNTPELRWQNKVHERIMGAKNYSHLPPNESLSLYHPKTIEKQEKQNKFYETL